MKIDLFCHLFPKNFYERMLNVSGKGAHMQKRIRGIPSIVDLDVRFRMMDRFPDYVQVICLAAPPIEALGEPPVAAELARSQTTAWPNLLSNIRTAFPASLLRLQ
jgi:aminocarboxymuconate-semialdehyde decarboxylase